MRIKIHASLFSFGLLILISCTAPTPQTKQSPSSAEDSIIKVSLPDEIADSTPIIEATPDSVPHQIINTGNVFPESLLGFARTLVGIPYKYASTDPAQGFDCSGFITYVFNNFKIQVPRSSVDFTNAGMEVPADKAMPGDLILFTGTDSTIRVVGHMGIVNERSIDSTTFIHSTSGKAYGVTITPLNNYYRSRFVKVIRIFPIVQ